MTHQPILESSPTSAMRKINKPNSAPTFAGGGGGDSSDVLSDVSASSSVGWSGDYCKKMMALNWDYTCGPLRVVQVGPHNHHWARLHAPGYAVLPRADGTLQHFRETHRHVSDADLLRQVLTSGVGKMRRDPKEKHLVPVQRSIRDVDVDAAKERLTKQTVPLPPARPPQTVFNRVQEFDDASTIFSRTDIGSSVVVAAAAAPVVSQSTKHASQLTAANLVAAAACSGSSVRKQRASGSDDAAGASSASQSGGSSHNSRPASRQQQQELSNALSQARSQRQVAASELAKAKQRLDAIEKIVEEHESSKRSSHSGSSSSRSSLREHRRQGPISPASAQVVVSLNQREISANLAVSRKAVAPFC